MTTTKAILINPNDQTITLIYVDHSNDDGMTNLKKLLDTRYFEAAPNNPITGDILLVADTFSDPQPESLTFNLPFVLGSVRGKAVFVGHGPEGATGNVKATVEDLEAIVTWG